MAVAEGFEPSVRGCRTRHFECLTFGRSDTLPCVYTRSTIPEAQWTSKSAFAGKEFLQQRGAFVFADSADDFDLVIEPRFAQHIEDRACGSCLRFPRTKYNTWNSGQDDRSRTHRTRLHGDHQRAISQFPGGCAQDFDRCTDGDHFGMSGWVVGAPSGIGAGGYEMAIWGEECRSDRYIIGGFCGTCHSQGLLHPEVQFAVGRHRCSSQRLHTFSLGDQAKLAPCMFITSFTRYSSTS